MAALLGQVYRDRLQREQASINPQIKDMNNKVHIQILILSVEVRSCSLG